MTDTAAIAGTFSELRPVKTRSVVQLIIEVPIEGADQALEALGGYPQPGKEVPVAVARLKVQPARTDDTSGPESTKDRRPWHELSPREQACIRCKEPEFQRWVCGESFVAMRDNDEVEDYTARWVREQCRVKSRSEILEGTAAQVFWQRIDKRYVEDTRLPEQRS